MATLHVHMDEAGCFNFSPKGSKYYCFAAVCTYEPEPMAHALVRTRYGLLRDGHDVPCFHATTDKQVVRDQVVSAMLSAPDWHWAGYVVDKRKVNPSIRDEAVFYPKFAGGLLAYVLRRFVQVGITTQVRIITDDLPVQKHKDAVRKAILSRCKSTLPPTVPFRVYHHKSMAHALSQAADYCCWGLQRKWEKPDPRTYKSLRPRLTATEHDALERGCTLYY